jgi:hypothetical protein
MGYATGRLWRLNGWGWFDKAAPFRNNCLQVDTPAAPRIGPTLNPQCENLMQIIKTFLAASLVLALAACGGGGDGPVDPLSLERLEVTGTPVDAGVYTQDSTLLYPVGGTSGGVQTTQAEGTVTGATPTKSFFITMSFTGSTLNAVGLTAGTGSGTTYLCGNASPACSATFTYNATAHTVRIEGLTLTDSGSATVVVNTLLRVQ